jgi:glycolate oxidase iron-sulfur subunit
VNYAELFEAARSDIELSNAHDDVTRTFWRGLTLGFLFMHPRILRAAGRVLSWYQRSGLESLVRRGGLMKLLPPPLRRLEPQTPRIAPPFSNARIAPHETPAAGARYRVAMLTGCVQDLVFPDVNRDTVDVLLANGCAVDTPPAQPCCGSLHAHNGDLDGARRLARRMLDLFPLDRYDAIVSNAGGCGSHLRRYGPLLEDDPVYRDRARLWDAKLRDIQEWLAEIGCRVPDAPASSEPMTVTYHESCHLVHGQKVTRQPRALLRMIPGVSLIELPEATWCCGGAGVYAITQPEQAELLLTRKAANIVSTGAQYVAAANPGCQLQIARGLDAAGAGVQVVHPISLLARAYRAGSGWRRATSDSATNDGASRPAG